MHALLNPLPLIVIAVIASLCLAFYIYYCRPAKKVRTNISLVIKGFKALENSTDKTSLLLSLNNIRQLFNINDTLKHLWGEYEETLHEQHATINGEQSVVAIRATIPAETYFTTETLIDTPLNTEFFKHLPGILTGIGIIGTFAGLITALMQFDITTPEKISTSLTFLMNGVLEAFIASAFAISMAMIVTISEKLILTGLYKEVEELVQTIDGLYKAGAGEEYLASLVKSSEESATQSKQLKDSFVSELKELLTNLTERQIAASRENNAIIAKEIGQTLSTSLEAPLNKISDLVSVASGRQGDAVNTMLQDTLALFISKIEETFGSQFTNLSAMMGESVTAINDMKLGFKMLIEDMGNTGKNTTEAMHEKLQMMMIDAENRQQAMNQKTSEFLEQVQSFIQQSHAENEAKYQQQHAAAEQQTRDMMATVGNEVGHIVEGTSGVVAAMQENIQKLTEVSLGTVEKMNSGADTMHRAAMQFAGAGDKVGKVLDQGTDLFSRLTETGAVLTASSNALKETVAAYNSTRNSLTTMIESLNLLFTEAEDKATINRAVINDMREIAEKFKSVQQETESYLTAITDVIHTGFNEYSQAVAINMNRSKGDFDSSLSSSVGMISNQLIAISDALESIPNKVSAAV